MKCSAWKKKIRYFWGIAAMLACVLMLSGCEKASKGLEFSYIDHLGAYCVSGLGSCTDTEIVIPRTHQGEQVAGIDANVFSGSTADAPRSITRVILPEGLMYIGDQAFCECAQLTEITIPDSVAQIGSGAFWGCYSLTSISLPNNPVLVGSAAFSKCENLTSVTIPDSWKRIEYALFSECERLESVTIPVGVTLIRPYAFAECESLTDIHYAGTMAQWDAVNKHDGWDDQTGRYTIHCTDGDIPWSDAE